MKIINALFFLQFIAIVIYTFYAGSQEGWNLIEVFFSDLASFNWPGQFNFDFLNYLLLSGLWIAWKHQFSLSGILLGVAATVLGIMFFAPYLLYCSIQTNGNIQEILLGQRAFKA